MSKLEGVLLGLHGIGTPFCKQRYSTSVKCIIQLNLSSYNDRSFHEVSFVTKGFR